MRRRSFIAGAAASALAGPAKALVGGKRAVLGGTFQPPPILTTDWAANDASAYPMGGNITSPAGLFDGTNTWASWRSVISNSVTQMEVATYNHSTGKAKGPYPIGFSPLSFDPHDIGSIVADSAGYYYFFYGCHAGALKIASTVNPNDPTRWRALADGPNPCSFPHPVLVGSTIYVFYTAAGSGAQVQSAVTVIPYTFSSGVLTPGTAAKLTDFVNDWTFIQNVQVVGTEIYVCFCWSAQGATSVKDQFILRYQTSDGSVKSFDGSTSIVAGSLPMSLSTAQTSFRIINQTGASHFGGTSGSSFYFDGTVGHLVYADASAQSSGGTLLYTNSSLSWGTPTTLFTYTGTIDVGGLGDSAIAPNGSSGLDLYYCDNLVGGGVAGLGHAVGDLYKITRSSGGSFGAATLVRAHTTNGLAIPSSICPIGSTNSTAQVLWQETQTTDVALAGDKVGAVGYSGNINIIRQYFGPAQDVFDRMTVVPNARWRAAYNSLLQTLFTWGLYYALDAYYHLDGPDTQTSRLNLIQNAWNLTVGGGAPTQLPKVGVTTNGTTDSLDSGFNTSSAVGRRAVANTACVFAKFPTLISANNGAGSRDVSANGLFIQATATNIVSRLNRFNSINVASGNGIGFYGATVNSSNVNQGFWQVNATTGGPVAISSGTNSNSDFIIGGQGSTSLLNCTTSMAGCGQLISPTQLNQIYLAELAWSAAIAQA